MARSAGNLGQTFFGFCKDQPLVMAGLGLAVGAAIGAALPSTEAEDKLMGESSDQLKARAQALANEQYEKAAGAAQDTFEEATNQAEKLGSEVAQAVDEHLPTAPEETEAPATAQMEPWHGER